MITKTLENPEKAKTAFTVPENQTVAFKSGNEIAALAASQINYHIMGYYPITPSTEIAEELDAMKAEGLHDIVLVPGDGEHGAAGICFGASTAGGRVFNATSAQGLLYALEQYPVQSGVRYPMVLNLAMRAISGPLDIRGDQSDVMFALNTGWIILIAKDQQAVYDFNIMAVKAGEFEDVRLPVIVAFDGFFTSHQKRRILHFSDKKIIKDYLGENNPKYISVDPDHPVTIGPYMNDPDLINNKKQQSLAMEAAYKRLPEVFESYFKISGRKYDFLETYQMEDAETVVFILGSAFDTTKEAVDLIRKQGHKVGAVMANVLRPFPVEQIQKVFKNVKVLFVLDRQESYGGWGGNMTIELKAALKDDSENKTKIFSRIYGLGGKDFDVNDAEEIFQEALRVFNGEKVKKFEYFGANAGENGYEQTLIQDRLHQEDINAGKVFVEKNQTTGLYETKGVVLRDLSRMPKRIAPGHGACPGCGIFPALNVFMKGLKGDIVVLFHTGCGMVVTTGYPYTSHRVTYIHNLFQNGAATLAGTVEMFLERKRRGEIPADRDITFLMVSGDGGMDIGMGPAIGTALRNNKMIILEYDNEGYMNTGAQLSFTTPFGHSTSTSNVGPKQFGKTTHHKDTVQIMAACHIPYVFSGVESNYIDLIKKAAKAQKIAGTEGMVYGKMLIACPLNWRSDDQLGTKIVQAAVDSNFFPLYEVEHGITTLNYDPEAKGKKIPVSEWFKYMGKTKHLLLPQYKDKLDEIQREIDRRWTRLKAMAENPVL